MSQSVNQTVSPSDFDEFVARAKKEIERNNTELATKIKVAEALRGIDLQTALEVLQSVSKVNGPPQPPAKVEAETEPAQVKRGPGRPKMTREQLEAEARRYAHKLKDETLAEMSDAELRRKIREYKAKRVAGAHRRLAGK